jgi:hypothetical protein
MKFRPSFPAARPETRFNLPVHRDTVGQDFEGWRGRKFSALTCRGGKNPGSEILAYWSFGVSRQRRNRPDSRYSVGANSATGETSAIRPYLDFRIPAGALSRREWSITGNQLEFVKDPGSETLPYLSSP